MNFAIITAKAGSEKLQPTPNWIATNAANLSEKLNGT